MYWTAGRDHIARKQRGAKSSWKDFGYLYLKVLEIEIKEDPSSQDISLSADDLERYLNDEIALMPLAATAGDTPGSATHGE